MAQMKQIKQSIIAFRDGSGHSDAALEAIRGSLMLLKDAREMGMTPLEAIKMERQAARDTISEAPESAPWHRDQVATYTTILTFFGVTSEDE